MSSGIPPTYYFNGITFNPSFYQSDEDYLTIKTAKSSFLTYPMSQGDELFSSNITLQSTLTDSTGSKGTNTQVLSSTETGVEWISGGAGIQTLGEVMTVENIASVDLDMNNKNITNLNSITSDTSLTGQITFTQPPISVTPLLGNDLTTKGYVDSLVGQYSGGFNLYLNFSETLTVNSITYKKLSHTVSSVAQQSITITTDGTNQLIASFISDAINITEIPTGLWSLYLYGGISATGGVVYYFFKIIKNSGGVLSDIATSGNSIDINATPSTNPDVYHMNATISSPISVLITDRIIIEIHCVKISGSDVQLTTYFESSYYSYIQTTLNAGTTLLSSNNNWLGSNVFNGNLSINSTLTDTSGDVGTAGQILSSTGSGTNWITPTTTGATYATYTASATLSLSVNPTLLVVFSGTTASQTLTIPFGYPIGQIIQFKSTASVNLTISSGLILTFLYGISATASTFTLIPYDVINLIYSGGSWFQYTPSNTFTKIVGANGCIAGQTNYVSINTLSYLKLYQLL